MQVGKYMRESRALPPPSAVFTGYDANELVLPTLDCQQASAFWPGDAALRRGIRTKWQRWSYRPPRHRRHVSSAQMTRV